jgi:hypothetical protein
MGDLNVAFLSINIGRPNTTVKIQCLDFSSHPVDASTLSAIAA